VSVLNAAVTALRGSPPHEFCAQLVLADGGRVLTLAGATAADVSSWIEAFRAVAAGKAPASAQPPAGPDPAQLAPLRLQGDSAALSAPLATVPARTESAEAPPLPASVVADGPAEAGSEVRCRALPDDSVLGALCVAWFRLASPPPTAADGAADVTQLPGFKLIAGAAAHTYSLTDEDVGKVVGCLCRPAVGGGMRWAALPEVVAPLDTTTASARLTLVAHEHNKYCDRRVRVCTAPGRYREGERLQLLTRGGPSGALAGFRSVWYRSQVVDPSNLGSEHAAATAGAAAAAAAASAAAAAVAAASTTASDKYTSAAEAVRPVFGAPDLSSLSFFQVDPRPASDLAPAPPDYAPSPTVAEIRARLAPRLAPAAAPAAGFSSYPLFKEDVGRMLLCALVPRGAAPPPCLRPRRRGRRVTFVDAEGTGESADCAGLVVTLPVGPIEAAPPKAREIWVEGECRVGCTLRGHAYYFGGFEGASRVSWVAIGESGDVVELRPPTHSPLPHSDAGEPAAGAGADDPRSLLLTPALVGSMLKYRVQPIRSDGNEGHTESSRPTAEVRAADSQEVS